MWLEVVFAVLAFFSAFYYHTSLTPILVNLSTEAEKLIKQVETWWSENPVKVVKKDLDGNQIDSLQVPSLPAHMEEIKRLAEKRSGQSKDIRSTIIYLRLVMSSSAVFAVSRLI